jgi:acetate---CoA ligase (ADP-forming)
VEHRLAESQSDVVAGATPPDLTRLFSPRGIAIVGASEDPRRIGGQPVKGLTQYGYQGSVYPVNPGHATIQGLKAYSDIRDVPQPCDVALIALPADKVPDVIAQCGEAAIPFAIVLSAGFAELGRQDLQDKLADVIRVSGVRVVGPNCTGLLNLKDNVYSGFGAGFRNPNLKRGPVAMVTQSGGFGYSVVAFAESEGVGFSHMLATGNEVDLTSMDMVEHLLATDDVEIIVCYMEGIRDGRRLRRVGARALACGKPIVVWKVGNTAQGRKAAVSHTANLTSDYALYKAAFHEGGFIEISDTYDLVDVVRALQQHRLPRGNRVGILTTSGGAGVVLTDLCEEQGLSLAELTEETARTLKELGGSFAAVSNPVDLSARLAGDPVAFNDATRLLLDDPNVDIAIVRSFAGTASDVWARGLSELLDQHTKPVLITQSGLASQSAEAQKIFENKGVPCFPTPGRVVRGAAAHRY